MTVLVDTSVWIAHWRQGERRLAQLLESNTVLVHPFVLGEIALGHVTSRAEVLADLATLDAPRVAEHAEVLALVEGGRLWGRGIGWVDAHLLASALLERTVLWTLDAPLARVARELGVAA